MHMRLHANTNDRHGVSLKNSLEYSHDYSFQMNKNPTFIQFLQQPPQNILKNVRENDFESRPIILFRRFFAVLAFKG